MIIGAPDATQVMHTPRQYRLLRPNDEVAEIRSLGKTLRSWRAEILAHHDTGASNGPTEGLNLCVKKVKRCGHGFRSFENHRLRVLLYAGGVTWPSRPRPPHIRTRTPYSDA